MGGHSDSGNELAGTDEEESDASSFQIDFAKESRGAPEENSKPTTKAAATKGKAAAAKKAAGEKHGRPRKQQAGGKGTEKTKNKKPLACRNANQRQREEDEEEKEEAAPPAAAVPRRHGKLTNRQEQDAAALPTSEIRCGTRSQQQQQQAAFKKGSGEQGKGKGKAGQKAVAAEAESSKDEATNSGSEVKEEKEAQLPRKQQRRSHDGSKQLAKVAAAPEKGVQPRKGQHALVAEAGSNKEQKWEEERPAKRPRRGVGPPQPAMAPVQQQQQQCSGSRRRQQQQQEARSPMPVAAAAADQPLEMVAHPASVATEAAERLEQRQQAQGELAALRTVAGQAHASEEEEEDERQEQAAVPVANPAADYLLRRLTVPRSKEAASMQLRPRLQEAYESLLESLSNTVELEHNNSLLVMGPRGSGKTLMTERALAALGARWNGDPRDPSVGVIRLSGLAHSEERTAFREVARQLCSVFQYSFSRGASIGENIQFLRGMLERLASCDKAAIFVLDEFDLFATKRSKQTLLYNLLDALQTSGMRAAVVGLTCRHDVVEMLEKRVKSRFSHRMLDLSLPTSVMPVVPQAAENGQVAEAVQDGALAVLKAMLTLPPDFQHQKFGARWNASVEEAAEAPEVRSALQRCINVYPSLRHLANIADMALAGATRAGSNKGAAARLTPALLAAAVQRQLSQTKAMVSTVASLSILDLMLLVAVHRVTAKGMEDLNFEMAYHEFQRYSLHGQHVDVYGKGAAAKAYDHLLSEGLVAFVDPRSEVRVGSRPYAAAYLQLTREEIEEGMAAHWNPQQSLTEWFKREGGLGTTARQFL